MNREQQPSPPDAPTTSVAEITAQAEAWVRRRDGGLDPTERHELRAWLAADSRHAEAFTQADRARTELDWPLHSGAMDEVLDGLRQRANKRRVRRRTTSVVAAAFAIVIAIGAAWRGMSPEIADTAPRSSTLIVQAPQRQTLPDGSVVDMKDGSEISILFDGSTRLVTLTRGTAHFAVRKDSHRSFIVKAGGVAVRAVGTEFSIELDTTDVTVLVTEGRVSVNQDAVSPAGPAAHNSVISPLAVLDVGNAVVLPAGLSDTAARPEVLTLPPAELSERLSWRTPRLEFSGTSLAEVVAMINQHNRRQFVFADRSLENLILSGVLRADKMDALVAMLESDFQIAAERDGERIILRRATRP